MPVQCPNCGFKIVLDETEQGNLTSDSVNQACRLVGVDYTNATKSLVLRLVNECSDKRTVTLLKFLNQVKKYPYDIVHTGILDFFGAGLHKKSYGMSYVVGMIKNKYARRKSQDSWLTKLPKVKE